MVYLFFRILEYIDFVNLPSDATVSIEFDPTTGCDNKKGEVSFKVLLSHYYLDGALIGTAPSGGGSATPPPPLPFTLTGFKKVTQTSIIKAIPGVTNFKASSVNATNIKNFFDVSLFPENVTFTGGTFTPNDGEGTLTISGLQASSGYKDDPKFTLESPFIVPDFRIEGLLVQSATVINVINNDSTVDKILATSVTAADILNKYTTISNTPEGATVSVSELHPNNLTGTVDFKLLFSSVYDEKGNLVKNHSTETLQITGFLTTKESVLVQKAGVPLDNMYVSGLNKKNISDYVDFDSFPKDTLFYQYKFEKVNNTIGTATFSVTTDR